MRTNRLSIDDISTLFFAPTEWAASNLLKENKKSSNIFVTGNTIVDFISNHPVLTANVLFSLKPLLTIAEYLFYMSKKMKRKQN